VLNRIVRPRVFATLAGRFASIVDNLGLPRNVILPWYSEDTPDQFGFTGNPLSPGFTDEGVGLFLDGYYGAPPNLIWGQHLPFFEGKFQTSTIRNAGQVPYRGFVKAYMHNGYLLSLKEVVHFYNTRDVYPQPMLSGHQRVADAGRS
jgi:cytochrome c peroxidase